MAVTLNYGTAIHGSTTISTAGAIVNTYAQVTAIGADDQTLTIGTQTTGLIGALAVGDEVMMHVSGGTSTTYVGNYGFFTISSISGSTVVLSSKCTSVVPNGSFSGLTVQLVKMAQYKDLTIASGASITAPAYNQSVGGIVAIRATGTLTLNGVVDVSGKGYLWSQSQPNKGGDGMNYNATGGGGGGNQFPGGVGGYDVGNGAAASAGIAVGSQNMINGKMFFGGSGGRGRPHDTSGNYSDQMPGIGGGILYIVAGMLAIGTSGQFRANGSGASQRIATSSDNNYLGGPGGGAGGCSLIASYSVNGQTSYFTGATGGGGASMSNTSLGTGGITGQNTVAGAGGSGSYGSGVAYQGNAGGGGGYSEAGQPATATSGGRGGNGNWPGGGGGGGAGYNAVYTNTSISGITLYPAAYTDTVSNPPDIPPNPSTSLTPAGTSTAPASVKTLTPTFSWTFSDPDAGNTQSAYQLQIYDSANTLIYDTQQVNATSSSYTLPVGASLQPNTLYYWIVRTWDNIAGSTAGPYTANQYFKTTSAPTVTNLTPGNPNSATPDGSSVNPRLSWTYADADNDVQTAYQVKITNASTGMLAYDSQKITSATTYHDVPSGALGAGIKFYWNVTVWDNTGMSSTSASEYILTNNPPAALTLMSPVDTYRTTTRPVFVANIGDDVENDKQNFKIQIAEDSNFTVNLQEKITTTVTGWEVYNGTSWVAMPAGGVDSTYEGKQVRYTWQADLPEGKKYYWRMAPIDGTTGTAGAWSTTRSVRIGNVLQFKLKAPVQTSVAAKKIVLTSNRKIPTDGATPATFKVEVCNNGLDAAPTWEDATSAMLNGSTYSFVNTTKTGTAFAVDCRITINANDSLGPIECDGLGFSFS